MTRLLHSLRAGTAYSGSGDVDSEWRGADAAAAVVAHTSVHVRVHLATDHDVTRGPQPVDDDPCACEEKARRNFTRRELAADLRRARAHDAATSSAQRDDDEPPADPPRSP